jgi:hypothetical protein
VPVLGTSAPILSLIDASLRAEAVETVVVSTTASAAAIAPARRARDPETRRIFTSFLPLVTC